MSAVAIENSFPSARCLKCREPVPEGERCFWTRGKGVVHLTCADVPPPPSKDDLRRALEVQLDMTAQDLSKARARVKWLEQLGNSICDEIGRGKWKSVAQWRKEVAR